MKFMNLIIEFLRTANLWVAIIGGAAGALFSQIFQVWFRRLGRPRLCFQTESKVPRRNAESCRVYLTDIFREGATEPLLKEDAMILQASSGGDSGPFESLSISRKLGRFFDIAFIDREKLLTVTSLQFKDRTNLVERLPPGTYEFRIVAAVPISIPFAEELRFSLMARARQSFRRSA
jgi:hypothetical protein